MAKQRKASLPLSALLSDPARESLRYGGPTLGAEETNQLHHLAVLLCIRKRVKG